MGTRLWNLVKRANSVHKHPPCRNIPAPARTALIPNHYSLLIHSNHHSRVHHALKAWGRRKHSTRLIKHETEEHINKTQGFPCMFIHSYSSQPCFFHVFRIAEGRTSESMAYIFQSSFTLSGSGNCDTKRELNADDGLVFVKADVQKP